MTFLPSANFIFSVIFKNNLELETGLMYYSYPYKVAYRWDTIGATGAFTKGYHGVHESAYHAFSFPIHIGYKFKLANRLYANIHAGLNFDFYFAELNGWTEGGMGENHFYSSTENALKQRFNILLSNRISLQYFTKFNMGISLYAAYNSGLFSIWESYAYASYHNNAKVFQSTLLSRGSYWNFGIELGYKLDKNRKR